MFACPECGCTEFYARRRCTLDIKVDGDNEFLDGVHPDDVGADIYDAEDPFGPYECVECGAEYDELC